MKKLCIYHSNCLDGFGAAYAVWKKFGDDVEFVEGVYQQDPPDCTDRDVIIVDFSYKRPVMEQIASVANSVTVLVTEEWMFQRLRRSTEEVGTRGRRGFL